MYSSVNENKLIRPDIADILQDYVSIQGDIDVTKIKAASLIAQDIDIGRVIGSDLDIFMGACSEDDVDEQYRLAYKNLISSWCFFTYARLLLMFHGSFSDSGLEIDELATERNVAKSISLDHRSIAESYLSMVIEELPQTDSEKIEDQEKLTPSIKTFGGKESR